MRTDPVKRDTSRSLSSEVVAVVLTAAGLLLLLSLLTYNAKDGSWNSVGPDHSPANLIGRLGAYLSDVFLQMFGLAAFTLPVILILISARVVFGNRRGLPLRKAIGASLLLMALSGLLALLPELSLGVLANARNGGAVGYVIEQSLTHVMNTAGAAIVMAAVSLLTLMLAMDVTLSAILELFPSAAKALRVRLDSTRRVQVGSDNEPAEKRLGVIGAFLSSVAGRFRRPIRTARSGVGASSTVRVASRSAAQRQPVFPATAMDSGVTQPADRNGSAIATLPAPGFEEGFEPDSLPFEPYQANDDLDMEAGDFTVVNGKAGQSLAAKQTNGNGSHKNGTEGDNGGAQRFTITQRPQPEVKVVAPNLGGTPSSQITMDPDVAEMISTASIVRNLTDGDTGIPPLADPVIIGKPQKKPSRKPASDHGYATPAVELLETPISHKAQAEEELRERATILAEKCKEFSVTGHIHRINPGPVVTTFEFKPDPGIKYSRVVSLGDDLCLALKAESIRIDRIPGKSTVGIEVPNALREKIYLREVVESSRFQNSESRLTIALGKTINGDEYVADLIKMPHLLIAGATGAGKSVTMNAIICSILYKASPEEVKFIMVDPKRLELGLYEGIPHLLTPIVTEPKRAANALKWATNEMENRYRELAKFGVRNIDQYNQHVRETTHPTLTADNPEAPKPLPYIVITIDELADLMMVARGDVETSIARLAQMARAVGIHLVVATQRPSVDVITGVIKANFPSRIAFRVSSKVDSRTIIDANGAEGLLGQGDMLFLPPASSRLIRVHGSFVNEAEIKRITDHTRNQAQPDYNEQVTQSEQEVGGGDDLPGEQDDLFDDALAIVTDMGRASTSVLQRRLSIGYGRAAKILDLMERSGFIGPADGSKPRKVLSSAYEFRERVQERIEEREI